MSSINVDAIHQADQYLATAAQAMSNNRDPQHAAIVQHAAAYEYAHIAKKLREDPALRAEVARINQVDEYQLMDAIEAGSNELESLREHAFGPIDGAPLDGADQYLRQNFGISLEEARAANQRVFISESLDRLSTLRGFGKLGREAQLALLGIEAREQDKVTTYERLATYEDEHPMVGMPDNRMESRHLANLLKDQQPLSLFAAAENLDLDRFQMLLRAGANPDVTNSQGETPLDVAERVALRVGDETSLSRIERMDKALDAPEHRAELQHKPVQRH